MDWVYDRLPNLEDIKQNRCEFFMVARRFDSYAQRVAFDYHSKKWYKTWKNNKWEEEVKHVLAWQPLPTFDYDEMRSKSIIGHIEDDDLEKLYEKGESFSKISKIYKLKEDLNNI